MQQRNNTRMNTHVSNRNGFKSNASDPYLESPYLSNTSFANDSRDLQRNNGFTEAQLHSNPRKNAKMDLDIYDLRLQEVVKDGQDANNQLSAIDTNKIPLRFRKSEEFLLFDV